MMQTAATTRGFVADPAAGPDVNRDFIGVGAANLLAGFLGAFPVDASPPRTAVVAETGGRLAAWPRWSAPRSRWGSRYMAATCWRTCRMRRWRGC